MSEPEKIGDILKRIFADLEEQRKGNPKNTAGSQDLNLGEPLPSPARLPVGVQNHGVTTG